MTARTDTDRLRRLEGDLELIQAKVESIRTSVAELRLGIRDVAIAQGELNQMLAQLDASIGLWRADTIEGR